jgi:hypothetical protein
MLPGTPLVSTRVALTTDCEERPDLAVSDQDAGFYASHKGGRLHAESANQYDIRVLPDPLSQFPRAN